MIEYNEILFGTPDFDEALKLRYEVLRKPLDMDFVAEDIAKEYIEHCCIATHNARIVGVIQLKIEGDKAKMRQVAVDPSLQNQGIGQGLVDYVEKRARELGCSSIFCHARDTAVPFYLKLNYEISKEPFEEVGIMHRYMSKIL